MPNPGPASEEIVAALSEFAVFRDYRDGAIDGEQYLKGLEAEAEAIEARLGGKRNLRLLAARYPADFDRRAARFFETLADGGFVAERPGEAPYIAFRQQVRERFSHGANRTFIHPDEARLAYFISMAVKPRRLVVIGSYYAYWAIWALPGVQAAGGHATLIDPNPAVCELARANIDALGFGGIATVRAEKGEAVFPDFADESLDFVMLDAAGGGDNPDPNYRGKGIYAFMAEGVYAKIRPGGLLAAHNDYALGVGDNALSHPFLEKSAEKLERFHAFCAERFRKGVVLPTPDGFGVYLK
ncbi:MAG: hypothetical protein BWZ10_01126 [candidate division BRC1 bacterium ADurb.BinA364]|nr:MAG: hypothetical protein BWZ10_01126 [candidate division BRC1 bacterium ADurb.BinA364]